MPAKLGQMRWKLAVSYAGVTALATFAWLTAVWLLTTWLLFYSTVPAYALLRM